MSWLWVSHAGGNGKDIGQSISFDDAGNSYGDWQWVKSAGGHGEDSSWGINLDSNNLCNITGYIQGTAYFGSINLVSTGYSNLFVARLSGDVAICDELSNVPKAGFSLLGANPFRDVLQLKIYAKENSSTLLKVYNLKGQLLENLHIAGAEARWLPQNRPAGIYLIKMYQDSIPVHSMKVTYIK